MKIFIAVIISSALSFAIGLGGGAILNRPARRNYDSKIEQIRLESKQSEQIVKEKLQQAQSVIQGLEKEVRYLNNELKNMTIALRKANKEVKEMQYNPIIVNDVKNHKENIGSKYVIIPKKPFDESRQVLINPIFGIRLGENLTILKRRASVSQSYFVFSEKDHPGMVWDVKSVDRTVKSLRIYTFQQRIYCIEIHFVDTSEINFDAIKNSLRDKYKNYSKQGLIDSLYSEYKFIVNIDGIKTFIKLNRDIGFVNDDTLELKYIYSSLSMKVQEEILRRKAARVDNKL